MAFTYNNNWGNSWGSTATATTWAHSTSTNTILTNGNNYTTYCWSDDTCADEPYIIDSRRPLAVGKDYRLPDGSLLSIDGSGNYKIEDKDAKVTYKANRVREFSPHINASDMLADFVKYVGSLGVKQSEVLGLPLELFVNWLIIEAAERDQDPVPQDVVRVDHHPALLSVRKPKCRSCGRFIKRMNHQHRFPFCGISHAESYIEKHRLRIAS
jgi:hypothetical protein